MRYLPLSEADRQAMLATIGVDGIDDLYRDVPAPVHLDRAPNLPPHADEMTVERAVAAMAARNLAPATAPCFLGAGAYRHHIPATVDDLIRRGEFLTAYTPYQPEISQGTLQTLFEFQTQVALITGMDVANASMYDGATACVEAIMMAERATRRRRAVISGGLHPHYRAVADTYARFNDFTLAGPDPDPDADDAALADLIDDGTACVVVQTPDLFGRPRNLTALAEAAHAKGALLVAVVTEVVSLGLLESPGAMGADIVAAEGQSLGNPTGFGGPHVGLLACRDKLVRQMPGRLAGQTVDADGRRGWVLTLVAREQHIRREKATSNICTNSGLCALAFSIHLGLLGEAGLTRLAELNHGRAVQAAERLARVPGVQVLNDAFFNEFTVRVPGSATKVVEALATRGLLAGVPVARLVPGRFDDLMLVAVTETVTEADIDLLARALEELP